MSIIPSIRKFLKRITASPVSAVIMFRFFARFVCLWIWAADFLSVNRWGQQHFAFPQTARQQQTDQPSSQIQHTQPKANRDRERERQIHRGKERGQRANELNCYYANKLHGQENSVVCSAGIVNVFADIWMCNVFAAICEVYCAQCTVYTLLAGTLLLFGNFD